MGWLTGLAVNVAGRAGEGRHLFRANSALARIAGPGLCPYHLVMRLTQPLLATGLILSLFVAAPAWGWGNKEHIQLTRLAVDRLLEDPKTPQEMKDWLRQVSPPPMSMDAQRQWFVTAKVGPVANDVKGLDYYVCEPDLMANTRKNVKLEPYNAPERLLHFIDLEFFLTGDKQRKYAADLSGKPDVTTVPHDLKDARFMQSGMLPFAVERSYQQLVDALRAGRLMPTAAEPGADQSATKYAGYLCHYLEDNFQPQHATEDYKSASYFSDKRHAPNVHSEVEWRMNDDATHDFPELRAEFWAEFARQLADQTEPAVDGDLFRETLAVSSLSYDALPLVGEAAVEARKSAPTGSDLETIAFFHHEGMVRDQKMTVLRMKARQQAWAVLRVQRVLLRAWNDAHPAAGSQPTTDAAGTERAAFGKSAKEAAPTTEAGTDAAAADAAAADAAAADAAGTTPPTTQN